MSENHYSNDIVNPKDFGIMGISFRNDLEEAIGIIVGQPPHSVRRDGEIIWGRWYAADSIGSREIWEEVAQFVLEIVEETRTTIASLPNFERTMPAHEYEHPPTAQTIPDIAIMLWEHGKPLLENLILAYETGKLLRVAMAKIPKWFDDKNREISELSRQSENNLQSSPHDYLTPRITLTQGAIVALVVAELVGRVGFQEDLEIDSQARGYFAYHSPGHPNGSLTYLIRVAYASEQYGYVVNSQGIVSERFRIESGELISLPLPDLLTGEMQEFGETPAEEKLRLRSTPT